MVVRQSTTASSAARQGWRHHQRLRVVRSEDLAAKHPWAASALCDALCDDGIVLLRLPADQHAAAKFSTCVTALCDFFKRDRAEKNFCAASDGPGQHVGYMCADEAGGEMFEAKVNFDPRWPWPNPRLRDAVLDARRLLHDAAMLCLCSLVEPLELDADALLALLDGPPDGAALAADPAGYFRARSNTTMRVWNYLPGGTGNYAHVDNTLLTVSPAGTQVGLGVRRWNDGTTYWPEARMRPDEVLLFAGDALGYLTGGRVKPLLHWVAPPRADGPARMSMPFFLRPRLDALLDQAAAAGGAPLSAPLGALRQLDLEHNTGDVRWSWDWKKSSYYHFAGERPYTVQGSPVRVSSTVRQRGKE